MIYDILIAPEPRLKQVAKPVEKFDTNLQIFIDNMLETMYAANGIGLAATQIGDMRRVLVLDVAQRDGEQKPMHFINPEISWQSEEENVYSEGCLSLPGYFEEVTRPARVKIRYQDATGNQHEIEADSLLATCLQHEIDHLNGKLFVDHISTVKRDIILRKLKKEKKLAASA